MVSSSKNFVDLINNAIAKKQRELSIEKAKEEAHEKAIDKQIVKYLNFLKSKEFKLIIELQGLYGKHPYVFDEKGYFYMYGNSKQRITKNDDLTSRDIISTLIHGGTDVVDYIKKSAIKMAEEIISE